MRPRIGAHVRSATDTGQLDMEIGWRLRQIRFSTSLNRGFDGLTATLVGENRTWAGNKTLMPFSEALAMWYAWSFARLSLVIENELAWIGRIWALEFSDATEHQYLGPCFQTAKIECSGFWRDLTADRDELPTTFTGEDRTVSASDIAALIPARAPAFGRSKAEIAATGTNVGSVRANAQSSLYDYLIEALRVSGANGVRFRFFGYEPERGPIIQPIDGLTPRWRLPLANTAIGLRRDLGLYSNMVLGIANEGGSGAAQQFLADAGTGAVNDVNGFRQKIVVSGSAGGLDGARELARTELALRQNPIALVGSPKLVDWAPNDYGQLEPCWRVRAGDGVELESNGLGTLLRNKVWVVESTNYDHDANTLTLDLDRQRWQPPRRSTPSVLVDMARLVEGSPANPHDPLKIQDLPDSSGAYVYEMTSDDTNFNWNRGLTTFTVPETRKYTLEVTAGFENGSGNEAFFYLGALVDDELDGTWDHTDPVFTRLGWINPVGAGNEELPLIYTRSVWLKHGLHRINVYSRCHRVSVGSMNYFVWNATLTVR